MEIKRALSNTISLLMSLGNIGNGVYQKVIQVTIKKILITFTFTENAAFVPRGLNTGLSLRTGHKIIYLDRSDSIEENFSEDTEFVIKGKLVKVFIECVF